MYRYNYGKKLPDLYINYFKQNKEVHNYNTRNRNKLHVSYKRTDYRNYTVFNKGISIWNCFDETIRNIKSFFSFKNKVKFYYLENKHVLKQSEIFYLRQFVPNLRNFINISNKYAKLFFLM